MANNFINPSTSIWNTASSVTPGDKMAKREFLQLAHNFNPKKHGVAGWFASEKLDGMRAFWDGGISRGLHIKNVAWANTERDTKEYRATGLWSRYGKVIHAPDWWLDNLPHIPIDGELYLGRHSFQALMSIVRRHDKGGDWKQVQYCVLDTPPLDTVFSDGIINNTNYRKAFQGICTQYLINFTPNQDFQTRLGILKNHNITIHPQEQLPLHTSAAMERAYELCDKISSQGGEGIVLKRPASLWLPERTHDVLKIKPAYDAEAVVMGYYWGNLPDNTRTVSGQAEGKLLGKMGSLVVEYKGKEFKLSGFMDTERLLYFKNGETAEEIGVLRPGEFVNEDIYNILFPRGSIVTFTYRDLSTDGVPKEARYLRNRL